MCDVRTSIFLFSLYMALSLNNCHANGLFSDPAHAMPSHLIENVKLIRNGIGNMSDYKGQTCNVEVTLSDDGFIKVVTIDKINELCKKAYAAVWSLAKLSMPVDKSEVSKYKKFTVVLTP